MSLYHLYYSFVFLWFTRSHKIWLVNTLFFKMLNWNQGIVYLSEHSYHKLHAESLTHEPLGLSAYLMEIAEIYQ